MSARGLARLLVPAGYGLLALLFMAAYTSITSWPAAGMAGFTDGDVGGPFRYRILVPLLARAAAAVLGRPLLFWIYGTLGSLAIFAFLLAYRALLRAFVRPELATLMAPAILYPTAWNYIALNRLYFPFDAAALFFFAAGWLAIQRRRWALYYPLLVLATLNRETSWVLPVVFALVGYRRSSSRSWALHLAAQAALWIVIKLVLYRALSSPDSTLFEPTLPVNLATWRGMLFLKGTGLKDWAKLFLAFGGLWLALPFVMRGQPEFVRRSLWAAVPVVIAMCFVGIVDEVRVYAEVVPLVATPIVIALARWVDGGRASPPPADPSAAPGREA
jgi:hypothetical protein